jgi:TRAP-type C4-dicarboxylate transport system permease small subunit
MRGLYFAFGLASVALGIYIAATSVVTDIQLGLVVTAIVGGLVLIGIAQLVAMIANAEDRLMRRIAALGRDQALAEPIPGLAPARSL